MASRVPAALSNIGVPSRLNTAMAKSNDYANHAWTWLKDTKNDYWPTFQKHLGDLWAKVTADPIKTTLYGLAFVGFVATVRYVYNKVCGSAKPDTAAKKT